MAEVRDGLYYSKEHEWIKVEGDVGIVGITDHAQSELGEIVFVELPGVGTEVSAGDSVATVESVKSASDIYTPVSGKIVEVNEKLSDDPSLINNSPYDEGWIFKIELSNKDELNDLMDAKAYSEYTA